MLQRIRWSSTACELELVRFNYELNSPLIKSRAEDASVTEFVLRRNTIFPPNLRNISRYLYRIKENLTCADSLPDSKSIPAFGRHVK